MSGPLSGAKGSFQVGSGDLGGAANSFTGSLGGARAGAAQVFAPGSGLLSSARAFFDVNSVDLYMIVGYVDEGYVL